MTDLKGLYGVELIKALSLEFGPSGGEDRVRESIKARCADVADEIICDKLGNLICKMSFGDKSSSNRKRIMISAHMDEIGFMVDGIRSDGMLTFGRVGGINASVVAGRKITLCGEEGLISGVICSKAIHHKEKDERKKAVPIDKLYMDIGYSSKEESQKHINIGDLATFDSEFYCFGKDGRMMKGKALDDRMGCAAIIEVMDVLAKSPLEADADVYFCFTVREEIGFSGAAAAATRVSPDIAIVLESTAIGDVPDTDPHRKVADVGEGAVISVADMATIYDRELVDKVLRDAKASGIRAQIKRYVSGGNDAGKIHKAQGGFKVLAVSVPTRYLHSPACVADIEDYNSVKNVAMNIIENFV